MNNGNLNRLMVEIKNNIVGHKKALEGTLKTETTNQLNAATNNFLNGGPTFYGPLSGNTKTFTIEFDTADKYNEFMRKIGYQLSIKTKSMHYPNREVRELKGNVKFVRDTDELPKYPIYIPTMGRCDIQGTMVALVEDNIPVFLIVDPKDSKEQLDAYYQHEITYPGLIKVLMLNHRYKEEYEDRYDLLEGKCDFNRDWKGPGPARNFAWDHSMGLVDDNGDKIPEGVRTCHKRHHVMDDNMIGGFYRGYIGGVRISCPPAPLLRSIEDFADQYENLGITGTGYRFESVEGTVKKPFFCNGRIYSHSCILNDMKDKYGNPLRWRCAMNEDTVLSIDAMEAGYCTVEHKWATNGKEGTQTSKGGNNSTEYKERGTYGKTLMLIEYCADLETSHLVKGGQNIAKFKSYSKDNINSRSHHIVNYDWFKEHVPLVPLENPEPMKGEYGMRFVGEPPVFKYKDKLSPDEIVDVSFGKVSSYYTGVDSIELKKKILKVNVELDHIEEFCEIIGSGKYFDGMEKSCIEYGNKPVTLEFLF